VKLKEYRGLFKEIVDGFSAYYVGEEKRYIKHQSNSDLVEFDQVYQMHFDRAKSRGLPSEQEILEELEKEEIWNKSDQAEIDAQLFYVKSLHKNKKNIYLSSAIKTINNQIAEAELKLKELTEQKSSLISNSCDGYALNRANDFYMFNSFYKTKDLDEPLYTQEEFENTNTKEVTNLVRTYNSFHDKFSEKNIQNLAVQDFYKIYYSFSESTMDFFGVPVVKLNNFQLNLLIYTRIFKNIFEMNDDLPDKIKKDPEALLDYANSSKAREEVKSKMSGSSAGSTIVGATKEDLEDLGMDLSSGKSLESEARKKGGELSMKDLMDLNGV
tara:strand:+ start:45 stop:1025 length:981 start_codon:yes stop_codon:yes gene_type:complete